MCCEIGATLGGANKESVKGITLYGLNLGIAFQIQDDLLDITADEEKFGKRIGGDLLEGKKTFKDFSESDEAIASNILSSRLKMLEEFKMISKEKLPHNKKTNIYLLTEKGLGLTPTIVELTLWSDGNIREYHSSLISDNRIEMVKKNKEESIKMLVKNYKEKNWVQECV